MKINIRNEEESLRDSVFTLLIDALQTDPDFERLIWQLRGVVGVDNTLQRGNSLFEGELPSDKKLSETYEYLFRSGGFKRGEYSEEDMYDPYENDDPLFMGKRADVEKQFIEKYGKKFEIGSITNAYYTSELQSAETFTELTKKVREYYDLPIRFMKQVDDFINNDYINYEKLERIVLSSDTDRINLDFPATGDFTEDDPVEVVWKIDKAPVSINIREEVTKTELINWVRTNAEDIVAQSKKDSTPKGLKTKINFIEKYSQYYRLHLLGLTPTEISVKLSGSKNEYKDIGDAISRYKKNVEKALASIKKKPVGYNVSSLE